MPQKKTKFISVNAKNCENPLLPGKIIHKLHMSKDLFLYFFFLFKLGRERCECQAVKHALINNCLSCGRIVCLQEGAGPCFFCGEIVIIYQQKS